MRTRVRWFRGAVVALMVAGAAASSPSVGAAAAPAAAGPALTVDLKAGRHHISSDIYGMNFADPALVSELGLTADRWGGNSTSRYNWQNNTTNTGSDWYFENIVQSPSDSVDSFVTTAKSHGAAAVVTVPLIGYVSKDSPAQHPFACGYPAARFPSQQSFDPYDSNCGNGRYGDGSLIPGAKPSDTSIKAPASFTAAYVKHLLKTDGSRSIKAIELDNEPSLWNSTHRDVHPAPLTYDELAQRSTTYAAAIKAAEPSVAVMGPSDWGWCAYFYSPADPGSCGPGPDRSAHGGLDFAAWYLQSMKAYGDSHGGVRLLDYFDEHYYPQSPGVALSSAGDAATQALRLRSTRSLWDPTYSDESWIGQDVGAPPIQMIPRMRDWVDTYDPGTKLAITEYNWGGLESINGALAEADVLGIFGRERLDLAEMWAPPASNQPGAFAFRMYRNYDGAGGRFGDTGVSASSADQGKLAVYAAVRSSDGKATLVVINKTGSALTSAISVNGTKAKTAARYEYSGASLAAIVHDANVAVSHGQLSATFPPNSITTLVL